VIAKTLRRVLPRARHTPAMAALKHLLNHDDEINIEPVHHAPYWDEHTFLEEYVDGYSLFDPSYPTLTSYKTASIATSSIMGPIYR
jgi:hypothetical protein